MSGIIGIVNLDGSAVDRQLVLKLTDFLTFRGPDGHRIWTKSNVGFGHTLFKTTEESEDDSQPLTFDGKTWIVADARIDAREELVAKLKSAGQTEIAPSGWTDAELILRAYQAWGENCVGHLLGDFAFGIWDETRQQLFCARDHMGVKPFYYAQIGSTVIFSNSLECVREHPAVSDQLNDLVIADFLLFGVNQDPATTSFHDIRRIPPAHLVSWSGDRISIRRYWSMPIDEPIFYKRADDYTHAFRELLNKCVKDRLRSNNVSIFMSGGIDSSTLAVATRDLLLARYGEFRLRAMTQIDPFVPDEGHYAEMVATHLGIAIDHHYWTRVTDFDWERTPFSLLEPHIDACLIPSQQKFWSAHRSCPRVFLYGEGPDNALLFDWKPYIAYLAGRKSFVLLARSAIGSVLADRRPPFWGRISKKIEVSRHAANTEPRYLCWLNGRLESDLQLRNRWEMIHSAAGPAHSIRPMAYASLQIPCWQAMFEWFNYDWRNLSFEVRHPFVDIRMLRFLLSVPPMPWCRNKYLLRKSMQGRLPNEILRRKKATPRMDLVRQFMSQFCEGPFCPGSEIHDFIDTARFAQSLSFECAEHHLRVRSLNHWLQNSYPTSHNLKERIGRDRLEREIGAAGR